MILTQWGMVFFPCRMRRFSMHMHRTFCLLARPIAAAVLLCGLFAVPAQLAAQQPYKIVDTWKLGGEGGWIEPVRR